MFNGSYMLDVLLLVHGASQDTLFFVQPRVERAGEDKAQLKRLGGSVNTTFHEKPGDKEKVRDGWCVLGCVLAVVSRRLVGGL